MQAFIKPFWQLGAYDQIAEKLKKNKGVLWLSGCVDSQKVHAACALWQGYSQRLIVTYSEQKAKEIYEDCRYFDRKAVLYQAKDFLFFHADMQGNLLVQQRVRALQALLTQEEVTVITTFDGLMDRLRPLKKVEDSILCIGQDSIVQIDALAEKLSRLGYEREIQVEAPGQFAVRGGIVDIFALTEDAPWRIEFWDDEVDSIRSFDVESQRSMENLEEIIIYPAAEPIPDEKEETVSFLDYFAPGKSLIFLDEPTRILEKGRSVEKEFEESMANRAAKGEALPEEARLLYSSEEITARLNRRNCVALSLLEQKAPEWEQTGRYQIDARSINPYNSSFPTLVKDLKRWKKEKYSIILMCASGTRAKRLAADLQDEELNSFYSEDPDRVVQPSEIMVVHGSLHRGYEYPMLRFAVLSETGTVSSNS